MKEEFIEKDSDKKQRESKTKEKIINASAALFYEKGYFNTSYDDICKAAGINRGLIHYYFKNKSNLAVQVEARVGTYTNDILKEDIKEQEKEVISVYMSYARLRDIFTNYPILRFYEDRNVDADFFEDADVLEVQREKAGLYLSRASLITDEEFKKVVYYCRGADQFLVYAYANGFFRCTPDMICEILIKMKLLLYGYTQEEIQGYLEKAKELYKKKATMVEEDFLPVVKKDRYLFDNVKDRLPEKRQKFLEEYEKSQKKTMKPKGKKKAILDLAKHVFWKEGYDALTYKRISEELGISEGIIAYHFKGKYMLSYLNYEEINIQIQEAIEKIAPNERVDVKLLMQRIINGKLYQGEFSKKYIDIFYKSSKDKRFYQLKLMEMESEVRRLMKKETETEEKVRIFTAMYHGIGQELIFQSYKGNYHGDIGESNEEVLEVLRILLDIGTPINDEEEMRKTKEILKDWEFALEKDFRVCYKRK